MMHRLLLALALLAPVAAEAVTLYYSRCDTGAHAACVAGSDSNDGLSASAPKLTAPTSTQINAASCGDQFLLAQGGRWDGYSSGIINHGQNCQTNPVIIGSYAPPSGATGRPRLHGTSTADEGSLIVLGSYNNTVDDRGYVFRGIELSSTANTSATAAWNGTDNQGVEYGMRIFGRTSYVTLEDVHIHNFRIGLQTYGNDTILLSTIDHLTIKNSIISDNYSMGMLVFARDMLIEGNTFERNNFTGNALNHAIYLNGSGIWRGDRITVRRNTFTDNSFDLIGGGTTCVGGNLTAHGEIVGMVLEENLIQMTDSGSSCAGFSLQAAYGNDSMSKLTVRRNRIINAGLCSICLSGVGSSIFENNVLVNLRAYPNEHRGFFFGDANQLGALDATNIVIRNNSIYIANSANSYGIDTVLIDETGTPSGNVVANNLIVFGSSAGAKYCHSPYALSAFSSYIETWCYSAGGAGALNWSGTWSSLATAQSNGYDSGATMGTDPLLSATPSSGNGYSMQLQSSSPAVGAGSNSSCARTTFDGKIRTGTCTPGAFQPGL